MENIWTTEKVHNRKTD